MPRFGNVYVTALKGGDVIKYRDYDDEIIVMEAIRDDESDMVFVAGKANGSFVNRLCDVNYIVERIDDGKH